MMAIDTVALLLNQAHLSRCIVRLETIDRKLAQENIKINYKTLQCISYGLVFGASLRKFLMVLFAFMAFSASLWHILCVYLPIFVSTLSKVWFVMLLCNIRMKFNAMNSYLEILSMNLSSLKQGVEEKQDAPVIDSRNFVSFISDQVSYLHKEIMPKPHKLLRLNGRLNAVPVVQLIRPFEPKGGQGTDADITVVPAKHSMHRRSEFSEPEYQSSIVRKTGAPMMQITDKFDQKLTKLCYWHDEICEIGKVVNVLFSFQMLVLMAYAFLSITAQFYFVYCGLVQQPVPLLFKSAENISMSIVYFASTAFCCVYIIYMCWQTKNASNQMGVFLHKVANIVDENHFYETVSSKMQFQKQKISKRPIFVQINHLSLKMLNHRLDFSACGFFTLDMSTVYAVISICFLLLVSIPTIYTFPPFALLSQITGAITSYLIILIQFNVAAQRGKHMFLSNSTARQY